MDIHIDFLMPTYNGLSRGHLKLAVESLLSQQTRAKFQILVVDDGSTDGSREFIEEIQKKDTRVRSILLPKHLGIPAKSCYYAFMEGKGDFIGWAPDDVVWEPQAVESLVNEIDENTDMVHGITKITIQHRDISVGILVDYEAFFEGNNQISQSATLVNREFFSKIGWLDCSILMRHINDWDFFARAYSESDIRTKFVKRHINTENGISNENSLGNSANVPFSVVQKWRSMTRILHLSKVLNQEAVPRISNLSSEEEALYVKCILEFCIEHDYFPTAKENDYICEVLSRIGIDEQSKFLWFAKNVITENRRIRLEKSNLQQEVLHKQEFIDEQREYIDKQQEFINSKLL